MRQRLAFLLVLVSFAVVGCEGVEVNSDEPKLPAAASVELQVPSDESLRIPDTRLLSFSAILSRDGEPDSWGARTILLEPDALLSELRTLVEHAGGEASVVRDLSTQIENAEGSARIGSDRVDAKYGDLKLGVFARFYPSSGKGLVVVNGGWDG